MAQTFTEIPKLAPRAPDAHKGTFGKALVVGGSRGMVGAPALAALAALRSGAGLVRIAVPESIQLTVAGLAACATTIPLAEDVTGRISRRAMSRILESLGDNDALALGPGMAQSGDLQQMVHSMLAGHELPVVVDADGLNNLAAGARGKGMQLNDRTILTPHPGEMQRLWSACFREELPRERPEQAEKLATRCGGVVVLKGAGTVVTNGQHTYINGTGNPGMATGGTGDVLTGMIVALLAGRMSAFDAAVLAVHVHGRAGDLAAQEKSQTALIASDLIYALPAAWSQQQSG